MPSQHLIVAGTGRTGTTALVQLFEAAGLDTGSADKAYFAPARAGLETPLNAEVLPYVVKAPYLSDNLQRWIDEGFDPSRIDAIVLPLRALDDAVASRIEVFVKNGNPYPGGLWKRKRPTQQRELLAAAVHRLMETAATYQIDVVPLSFPKFITDHEYCYQRLHPLLPDVDESHFLDLAGKVLRPDFVNEQRHFGSGKLVALDVLWSSYEIRRRAAAARDRLGRRNRSRPGR